MLIVARRKGQRIRIGGEIEVVVTELSKGEVRLGILAPKEVLVLREEVRSAVADANRAAARSPANATGTPVVGDLAAVEKSSQGKAPAPVRR